MSNNNQKTVRELINELSFKFDRANLFYGHGTDNPFDEAVYLVFSLLNFSFDIGDEKLNEVVDSEMQNKIEHFANRRISERLPVAYLVNKAWFCGISFYVDERVLIPRSPMAELIEEKFSPWIAQSDQITRILDIGTGSACIAIAASIAFPNADVDAIDSSEPALDVARINVEQNQLLKRVNLIQSNMFENLQGNKYDLIIANPPYVDAAEMGQLPEEYRHEPASGLAAGKDGLDFVRTIIEESKNYLNENSVLIVEVGNSRKALEKAFPNTPFTWLEFERGGDGVFLLYREDLLKKPQRK